MNLVIPISLSDAKLASDFALAVNHFNPGDSHNLILFPTPDALSVAQQLEQDIGHLFVKTEVKVAEMNLSGWPVACGVQFRLACQHMQANYPQKPWYLCELDVTPVKDNWLTLLEEEMLASRRPYMGMIVPTRVQRLDANGKLEFGTLGQHMVGTGFYPWNAYGASLLMESIDKVMPWVREPPAPYDVMMANEIVPRAHNSTQMQHNWRTLNYRRDGNQIVCDDDPNNPPGTSHKKPIDPKVVVVHGCRDGSLARLLSGTKKAAPMQPKVVPMIAPLPQVVKAPEPEAVVVPPEDSIDLDWLDDPTPAPVAPAPTSILAPVAAPKPLPVVEIDPDVWKLRQALGKQRLQYTTLARKSGVDREKVFDLVNDLENGFSLSKNGGWVTLAT